MDGPMLRSSDPPNGGWDPYGDPSGDPAVRYVSPTSPVDAYMGIQGVWEWLRVTTHSGCLGRSPGRLPTQYHECDHIHDIDHSEVPIPGVYTGGDPPYEYLGITRTTPRMPHGHTGHGMCSTTRDATPCVRTSQYPVYGGMCHTVHHRIVPPPLGRRVGRPERVGMATDSM